MKMSILAAILMATVSCTALPKRTSASASQFPRVDADLIQYDQKLHEMESSFQKIPANPQDHEWVKLKLRHMFDVDQFMRNFSMNTAFERGYTPDEKKYFQTQFAPRFSSVDQRDTSDLKDLLKIYTWFKISEFGKEADNQAWIIVQHADLDPAWQSEILKILTQLWKVGETNPSNYAYLYDRVAASWNDPSKRKLQLYGTQGTCNGTDWKPLPIDDEPHLDIRRRDVGLPSEADYIKVVRQFCH